jgi:4-amino-4-deoxy-L-arabinose transferase-like glycosyltransferase
MEIGKNDTWIYILALLLVLPAMWFNLDLVPLNHDDGLRGLVAFEMSQSREYIVPMLQGEYYYVKPPVFNWMIALSASLFGGFSNFAIRFPVTVCLLLFTLTVFLFTRKTFGWKNALSIGLLTLTTGHVLFESSRVGRIDIPYSWLIFTQFMVIYHYFIKGDYWRLFVLSYAIAAVAYLTKGLPTVAFQGFTLIAWFAVNREFRRLFSIKHLAGLFTFAILVGAYYGVYYSKHPDGLTEIILALWSDSNERSVAVHGFGNFAEHVLMFPFRLIYEMAPWSILLIATVRKGWLKTVKSNALLWFCFVVFFSNSWVYWLSPGSTTRYLIMFFPLILTVLMWFYAKEEFVLPKRNLWIARILASLLAVSAIGVWYFALGTAYYYTPNKLFWVTGLSAGFFVLFLLWFKFKESVLILMVCGVLLGRASYNVFIRPALDVEIKEAAYRAGAEEVARLSIGKKLKLWQESGFFPETALYIGRIRNEVLTKHVGKPQPNTLYIVNPLHVPIMKEYGLVWEELLRFPISEHEDLLLVEFDENVKIKKIQNSDEKKS